MPLKIDRAHGRFCNFSVLLYNEDSYYNDVLTLLQAECLYAAIVHDNDLLDDGVTPEKIHTHVVVRFKTARSISSLASFLGVPDRLIQPLTRDGSQRTDSDDRLDLVSFYRYLIHNTDKCRANRLHWSEYSVAEVFGTLAPEVEKYNNPSDSSDMDASLAQQIFTYISDSESVLSISDVTAFCLANGLWSAFRRGFAVFSKVILDHNYVVENMMKER